MPTSRLCFPTAFTTSCCVLNPTRTRMLAPSQPDERSQFSEQRPRRTARSNDSGLDSKCDLLIHGDACSALTETLAPADRGFHNGRSDDESRPYRKEDLSDPFSVSSRLTCRFSNVNPIAWSKFTLALAYVSRAWTSANRAVNTSRCARITLYAVEIPAASFFCSAS